MRELLQEFYGNLYRYPFRYFAKIFSTHSSCETFRNCCFVGILPDFLFWYCCTIFFFKYFVRNNSRDYFMKFRGVYLGVLLIRYCFGTFSWDSFKNSYWYWIKISINVCINFSNFENYTNNLSGNSAEGFS